MQNVWKASIAAAAVAAMALPMSFSAANAMPAAQPLPLASGTPAITLTAGGCGPYRHRGFYGRCIPFGGYRRFGFYGPRRFYGYHRFGYFHRRFY